MSLAAEVSRVLTEISQERRRPVDLYRGLDPRGHREALDRTEGQLLQAWLCYSRFRSYECERVVRDRISSWDLVWESE